MLHLTGDGAASLLSSPWAVEDLAETGAGALVAEFAAFPTAWPAALPPLPCVTIAVLRTPDVPPAVLAAFDVVVADPTHYRRGWVAAAGQVDAAVADLVASVEAYPSAALTSAQVLRATERVAPPAALTVESLAYSMLQSGSEFRTWLSSRPPATAGPSAGDGKPAVQLERDGSQLVVSLNRPDVHNAMNSALRDGLVDALRLAAADPSLTDVVLRGNGPSFCSGGDLAEFGTAPDPVTAHAIRLARSPAFWAATVASRLRVQAHGACIGAGVEIAAWGHDVAASEGAFFQLPEVGMGLIPGAGGTASIPRRIGRQRTAYLAMSGCRLDAATALAWGLVDRLVDPAS